MRKTMIIPTYWCRKTGDPWQEGDAVYDHPTPVDQEGTLERTLVNMKQFHEKDFKLVILICPTTPEVETAAYEQVLRIVRWAQLNAETYLFTAGDLREITEILSKARLNDRGAQLLDYCHVKTYYEHETVFTSGDYNEEVCLVLKGKLRLVANREANSRSAPLEIAYLTPGSFLGENCLSHSVFRLSGTAAEFTELLCISRGRLKALLEEHPAIGVKLLQCFLASLSEKIMRSNELRREAAAYDHNAVNEK